MNNKRSKFTVEILGVTLWEAVKFVFGLFFSISSSIFVSQIVISFFSFLANFKWSIIITFGTGGFLIFLFLYQKLWQFRPSFPCLNFDFQLKEKEITYEYKDKTHMLYKKRVLLKALKDGLDAYHDKYHWTGNGNINVKTPIKEHHFRETTRKNVWQFYEIRFQKTLKKGEEMEIEAIWELEDKNCSAVPFFSATIEEPTDFLKLNLIVASELGVRQATCEVSSIMGAKKPFSSETINLDRNHKASWEIKKPKLLHYYEIKWTF